MICKDGKKVSTAEQLETELEGVNGRYTLMIIAEYFPERGQLKDKISGSNMVAITGSLQYMST